MSMAAYSPDPENARPAFIRLRKLATSSERAATKKPGRDSGPVDGHDRRLRSRDPKRRTIVRIGRPCGMGCRSCKLASLKETYCKLKMQIFKLKN